MAAANVGSPTILLKRAFFERPVVLYAAQVLLLAVLLLLWEGAAGTRWINGDKIGHPSGILRQFVLSVHSGELWKHLGVTLYEEVVGFAVGVGSGVAIGLGLWWSRTVSRIVEPFAVVFNGIPKIALGPPMIVWFGIFETSKIVLAATICFVVAWLSAYAGTRAVDRDLLDMCRAIGGSRWQTFTKVVVPSSMPWIISTLKINIGFALTGAVVGEFVASNHGLGHIAVQASILYQINRLWMVVFVITLLAAVQYWGVLWLEGRLLRWMGGKSVGIRA